MTVSFLTSKRALLIILGSLLFTQNIVPATASIDTPLPKRAPEVIVGSSFDSGDEGWTCIDVLENFDDVIYQPVYVFEGGKPDGYVRCEDMEHDELVSTWYWVAPDKFLGDGSAAYGRLLTFDLIQIQTGGFAVDETDVILGGAGLRLLNSATSNPFYVWTPNQVTLDESGGWIVESTGAPATQEDISTVLADLDQLWIRGEFRGGPDFSGLDNVVLGASDSPWPMYLASSIHSGYNPSEDDLIPPLAETWRFEPPLESGHFFPAMNTPVISHGLVYVASTDNTETFVYALDERDGSVVWSTIPFTGKLSYSSPIEEGGTLFILVSDAVYAISTANGDILWDTPLPGVQQTVPVVDSERLYLVVSDTDEAFALDKTTGEVLWSYTPPESTFSTSGNPILVNGQFIYFTGQDVIALNKATGELAWSRTADLSTYYWDLLGSNARNLVYVYADNENFLEAWDADTGDTAWSFSSTELYPFSAANLVLAQGQIYHLWGDGFGSLFLMSFNADTGKITDQVQIPDLVGDQFLTAANGVVYIANTALDANDSSVYAIDMATGERLWTAPPEPFHIGAEAPLSIANDKVFAVYPSDNAIVAYGAGDPIEPDDPCQLETGQMLGLCITDETGSMVSGLTTNAEGWLTPNPLKISVTINNDTAEPLANIFNLAIDFTEDLSPGRFFILRAPFDLEGSYSYPIDNSSCYASAFASSYSSYSFDCLEEGLPLLPGESMTLEWTSWIQPSDAANMVINASYCPEASNENEDCSTFKETASLSIPQAQIKPVVFVHGVLGSMPPGQNFWETRPSNSQVIIPIQPVIDPFLLSYYPMLDHLERVGYEWGTSLFGLTYDWRDSNDVSAAYLDVQLDDVRSRDITGDYIDHSRSDLVVHSMGGLVSRAYIQNESIYDDDIGKVVFMASPHKGFASDYRTYEGVTWYDYFENEVSLISDLDLMNLLMDQILWPHLIKERYDPNLLELLSQCILVPPLVVPGSGILPSRFNCAPALYDWTHDSDPDKGVPSLFEMLPANDLLSGTYLFDAGGGGAWPCNSGTKPAALENTWLQALNADVSSLAENLGGSEQIYVLYSEAFPTKTIGSYEVECKFNLLSRWPHGKPETIVYGGAGDDLILAQSTTLEASGLLDLPAGHEIAVTDTKPSGEPYGHKGIMYSQMAESKVAEFLTGETIPGTAAYNPSISLANIGRIIVIVVNSPVSLELTNPHGQQIGIDSASGTLKNDIADAFYTGYTGDQFMLLFNPSPGDYRLAIQGQEAGAYLVETFEIDAAGVRPLDVVEGEITAGEIVQRDLSVADDPGQEIFFDDMESGPDNWSAAGGWDFTSSDFNSPSTAWSSGALIETGDQLLSLAFPLDLSKAERAKLTFWGRHDLSSQAAAAVELSADGGQTWQTLRQRMGESRTWSAYSMNLDAFSGPGFENVLLRFRILPRTTGDQWLIDDVLIESLDPPPVFYPPFEDDVEGWPKWLPGPDWAIVSDRSHSDDHSWSSSQPGTSLTLAGDLVLLDDLDQGIAFWYQLEGPESQGFVEVSVEEGQWETIGTVTPTGSEWLETTFDLKGFRGQVVGLRYRLDENATGAWWIDDIRISDQHAVPEPVQIEGKVTLEQGECCLVETEGETLQVQAGFEASSSAGEVTEMRIRTGSDVFSEAEMALADWVLFSEEASYPYLVPPGPSVFILSVQFRDAQGNLSGVVSDDIEVEGVPPVEEHGVRIFGTVNHASEDGEPLGGVKITMRIFWRSSRFQPHGGSNHAPHSDRERHPFMRTQSVVVSTADDGSFEAFLPTEQEVVVIVRAHHSRYRFQPWSYYWRHPAGYEQRELNFIAVENR
jgi:outer membrane protein assembly factor BamB